MPEKKRNKKKKYEAPCLEEVSIQEGGGIATGCSNWRGVHELCSCGCENGGSAVN